PDVREHFGLGEPLQDAETKCGAPDASAGKCQGALLVVIRRLRRPEVAFRVLTLRPLAFLFPAFGLLAFCDRQRAGFMLEHLLKRWHAGLLRGFAACASTLTGP